MAYTLVIALTGFFTPVFESVLVPLFTQQKNKREKVLHLANGVVWILMPAVALMAILASAFLPYGLIHWSGLGADAAFLVRRLFLEMFPMLLLGVWIAGGTSLFYTYGIFWFPAVSPLVRSLLVFAMILLFHRTLGIYAITAGFSAGELVRWGAGAWLLWRASLWAVKAPWKEIAPDLKEFYRHSSLQLLAFFAINIIPMTDQFFATWLGAGQVSLLSYAARFFDIPFQFCMTGLLQIFLSDWSEAFHFEPHENLKKRIGRDIRNVLIAGSVLVAVLWTGRYLWVRLLFGLSRMTDAQLWSVADVFGWLILGFVPAVLHLMYCRILFVMKKSFVFFLQAWIKLGMNVLFDWLLVRKFGIQGIAMSTTLVFTLTALWLHFYVGNVLKRRGARLPGIPS